MQLTAKTGQPSAVEAYVEAGIAPATRPVYRADLDHFEVPAEPFWPPRIGSLSEGGPEAR